MGGGADGRPPEEGMSMRRLGMILVGFAAACHGLADAASVGRSASTALPVVFEGLGLEDFNGVSSVASALRGVAAEPEPSESPLGVPMDVLVKGPSGRTTGSDSLAAELKSRIEGVDFTAGMQADPTVIQEGPAKWVGGLGVATDHELGRGVLELKTSLGRNQQAGILGVEVGPRIERRLRGGLLVFLDGKAQAQAQRSADTGTWMLPSLAEQGTGGGGMVGVAASTGLVR
jgi:hypothetical protein